MGLVAASPQSRAIEVQASLEEDKTGHGRVEPQRHGTGYMWHGRYIKKETYSVEKYTGSK